MKNKVSKTESNQIDLNLSQTAFHQSSKLTSTKAGTATGSMMFIAIEQLFPEQQRIICDDLAYHISPLSTKFLVQMCKFKTFREIFYKLVERKGPGVLGGVLSRKRFIEEKLIDALHNGIKVVVILGAGLDTLAYRIPELLHTQVFELDLPQNIEYKLAKLQQLYGKIPAHVILVPIDFNVQDLEKILKNYGYSIDQKCFFAWEGVTQYLPEITIRRIFEFLSKVSPGSRMVFTYIQKDFIDGKNTFGLDGLSQRAQVKENWWIFGLQPLNVATFIGKYFWKELEQVGTYEYRKRYFEPLNRKETVMEIERAVHAEKVH